MVLRMMNHNDYISKDFHIHDNHDELHTELDHQNQFYNVHNYSNMSEQYFVPEKIEINFLDKEKKSKVIQVDKSALRAKIQQILTQNPSFSKLISLLNHLLDYKSIYIHTYFNLKSDILKNISDSTD